MIYLIKEFSEAELIYGVKKGFYFSKILLAYFYAHLGDTSYPYKPLLAANLIYDAYSDNRARGLDYDVSLYLLALMMYEGIGFKSNKYLAVIAMKLCADKVQEAEDFLNSKGILEREVLEEEHIRFIDGMPKRGYNNDFLFDLSCVDEKSLDFEDEKIELFNQHCIDSFIVYDDINSDLVNRCNSMDRDALAELGNNYVYRTKSFHQGEYPYNPRMAIALWVRAIDLGNNSPLFYLSEMIREEVYFAADRELYEIIIDRAVKCGDVRVNAKRSYTIIDFLYAINNIFLGHAAKDYQLFYEAVARENNILKEQRDNQEKLERLIRLSPFDRNASTDLSKAYLYGTYGQKDYDLALKYALMAEGCDNGRAVAHLASFYMQNPSDRKKAYKMLKPFIAINDIDALKQYAHLLLKGDQADEKKAYKLLCDIYKRNKNDLVVNLMLVYCLVFSHGIDRDLNKAYSIISNTINCDELIYLKFYRGLLMFLGYGEGSVIDSLEIMEECVNNLSLNKEFYKSIFNDCKNGKIIK